MGHTPTVYQVKVKWANRTQVNTRVHAHPFAQVLRELSRHPDLMKGRTVSLACCFVGESADTEKIIGLTSCVVLSIEETSLTGVSLDSVSELIINDSVGAFYVRPDELERL